MELPTDYSSPISALGSRKLLEAKPVPNAPVELPLAQPVVFDAADASVLSGLPAPNKVVVGPAVVATDGEVAGMALLENKDNPPNRAPPAAPPPRPVTFPN